MDQIRRLLASLDLKQKAAILLAAVAVVVCAIGFTRWQHERGFKPLYSGLAPDDASAVVQKLKESGVEYRVADNGATILAAEERIPELRLEMAGAGVPKSGRIGFELFDKTNLGITDFTEHVNYRRAIEGELERSVKCLNEVEQARVHVTFPGGCRG
jgi:flagellar M-ring protein FliF